MRPTLSLGEIVEQLGGRVAGDAGFRVAQVATLAGAGPRDISFLANPRYRNQVAACRAGAVILGADAEALTARPRIVAANPYAYFARVSRLLNPPEPLRPGIDAGASVSPDSRVAASARIDAQAVIGPGAVIGERALVGAGTVIGPGTRIGADTRVLARSIVMAGVAIGERCVLHPGSVIGADGFGIAREDGRWIGIPQIGSVRIGDEVEVGACTAIDRGAIEDTVIEEGVKLDNHIQIGHNVRIGAHTALAGCVAVAGSARIGRHCTIGAAAIILGHLSIADHCNISAGTLVDRSIDEPGTYTGVYPFATHARWGRNAARARHLDEELADLKARLARLEQESKGPGHG